MSLYELEYRINTKETPITSLELQLIENLLRGNSTRSLLDIRNQLIYTYKKRNKFDEAKLLVVRKILERRQKNG
jgi:hypothetical protein